MFLIDNLGSCPSNFQNHSGRTTSKIFDYELFTILEGNFEVLYKDSIFVWIKVNIDSYQV